MTGAEREQCVAVWRKTCQAPGMAARKPQLCRHFADSTAQVRMARLRSWRKVRHA
jgi:hypothetical protein